MNKLEIKKIIEKAHSTLDNFAQNLSEIKSITLAIGQKIENSKSRIDIENV